MISCNHCTSRHQNFNVKLLLNKCPRCRLIEPLSNVVQCKALVEENKYFIAKVAKEILKVATNEQ